MQAVRELLPRDLWRAMEKSLGRDETLRLLWPAVVGRPLASQTKPVRVVNDGRGGTLLVSVGDSEWRAPIASLGEMILGNVNAFWGREVAARIEFVVRPALHETSAGVESEAPASLGQGRAAK